MSAGLRAEGCRLEDFVGVLDTTTDAARYPHSDRIADGVLVYRAERLRNAPSEVVEDELTAVLADGPGIVVIEQAFAEDIVEKATDVFNRLIEQQRASGAVAGDHFAAPGANDRVWNALEKLAIAEPEAFVDYYSNDILALVARAWLGPGYQVTSQVNVVNPGGKGQTVHRDYHLGFLGPKAAAAYPEHVHRLSPVLTLQGAVAHCDMPVESGPTLYLPHSQKYLQGYLAYTLPEFQDFFAGHHVQLPLRKGDAVFFNPALFHAAGSNHTENVARIANLLQISSAFGRAMETVDRVRVIEAIYPTLLSRKESGMDATLVGNAVAASAEGYAFPTNLDLDPPVDGMSPPTMADLVTDSLAARQTPDAFAGLLAAHVARHRSR